MIRSLSLVPRPPINPVKMIAGEKIGMANNRQKERGMGGREKGTTRNTVRGQRMTKIQEGELFKGSVMDTCDNVGAPVRRVSLCSRSKEKQCSYYRLCDSSLAKM